MDQPRPLLDPFLRGALLGGLLGLLAGGTVNGWIAYDGLQPSPFSFGSLHHEPITGWDAVKHVATLAGVGMLFGGVIGAMMGGMFFVAASLMNMTLGQADMQATGGWRPRVRVSLWVALVVGLGMLWLLARRNAVHGH